MFADAIGECEIDQSDLRREEDGAVGDGAVDAAEVLDAEQRELEQTVR